MSLRTSLEPFVTPLFRIWWRLNRGMTLGVRGAATDAHGRVLLIRHTYRPGWHLPGGGVESGEIAIESLIREMEEEGGVSASSTPVLFAFYANHASFKNDHVLVYKLENWTPCPPPQNGEIEERGFFALNDLPEGVTAGTRRRLAELFEGAPVSPNW